MSGLEELKKKLIPLFEAEKGLDILPLDPYESYLVSDGGTVNLLSESDREYNIDEMGLKKCVVSASDGMETEKIYRCASNEMHIFGIIGCGASSIVHRAIHVPIHRLFALKRISIFEEEKRKQLLNEIRSLCEASCFQSLVEFHGAFYSPESGKICIMLEYMDGGSFADILREQQCIPEPVLSTMLRKLLRALIYLHGVRCVLHRDIKPANILVNLHGETKISDFGISAYLHDSMATCANFVGTVTYMSPERIQNKNYSYPSDVWSLGLTVLECASGNFPYSVNEGPANLMLQILNDPPPAPSEDSFSPEFCSFIDACLQKDPGKRATADQLLSHPFIKKYEKEHVDLEAFVRNVFDPVKRLKEMADIIVVHYYILFDGTDELWRHIRTFYNETSTLRISGEEFKGQDNIYEKLSDIRQRLATDRSDGKQVHVLEQQECSVHGKSELFVRSSGSFVAGPHFLEGGAGAEVEGIPSYEELSIDLDSKRLGTFYEQFTMNPGNSMGTFIITLQELYMLQD